MQKDHEAPEDELRPKYDRSDLRQGVRGKHFDHYRAETNLARLEPDVRAAFPSDEAVNQALRSLIRAR